MRERQSGILWIQIVTNSKINKCSNEISLQALGEGKVHPSGWIGVDNEGKVSARVLQELTELRDLNSYQIHTFTQSHRTIFIA